MRNVAGLELQKSPLVSVLAQIRFPAFLSMEDVVPEIQSVLRKAGLVEFQPEHIQQVEFGPKPKSTERVHWNFFNRERTELAVLAPDFFIYQVSAYQTFDDFLPKAKKFFEPIKTYAELAYGTGAGLRYVDLLRSEGGLSIDQMISPSLNGLSAEQLSATAKSHQFVISAKTKEGQLSIRSYEHRGKLTLPPGLDSAHLKFSDRMESKDTFRVLDLDHVTEEQFDLDEPSLDQVFWGLHAATDHSFRNLVTKEALQLWRGESQ